MKTLNSYQLAAQKEVQDALAYFKYETHLKNLKLNSFNLDFQEQALKERAIQIDAPTGAGKTVLLGEIIRQDLKDFITFVFTPGAGGLEKQTYSRLKETLGSRINLMSSAAFGLTPAIGESYVANWEQLVTRDRLTGEYKNSLVREGDKTTFFDMILKIGSAKIPVAVVIDESHYGKGSETAITSFLNDIKTKLGYSPLLIELSATPIATKNATKVIIPLRKVIQEGFVRKTVRLNPASLLQAASKLSAEQRASIQIETFLLNEALNLSDRLTSEYRKEEAYEVIEGEKVYYHPLIGIQMPNGTIGNEAVIRIENFLREKGITRENGQLVVYMSTDKSEGLTGIESPSSPVRVLIYKQAVATGWDCPRAQILVGFRHITSKIFTKQNLGRFVRTTQRKHYNNDLLDSTYVLSNVGDLGQASFGDDIDMAPKYEKESRLRVDENGHISLSTFNQYKLPVSHYANTNQTVIPAKELSDKFKETAIRLSLAHNLQYSNSAVLSKNTLKSAEADMGLINNTAEFIAGSETKTFAANDVQQYNDFVEQIYKVITAGSNNYGNNSQVARKFAKLAIRFYRDTLTTESTPTTPYGSVNKGILDIIHSEELTKARNSSTDLNDLAVEQLSLDPTHFTSLAKVITETLKHFQKYQFSPELENEMLAPASNRVLVDDGFFEINLQNIFWAEHKPGTEVGAYGIGLASKYATVVPTTQLSLREGAPLSKPEKSFEREIIQISELCSYMKSPENKKGSFCLAVSTPSGLVSNFYPDYLLEIRDNLGLIRPAIIEVKDKKDIKKSVADENNLLFAKAKTLMNYSSKHDIKAAVAYERVSAAGTPEWVAITGINDDLSYKVENLLSYLAR